MMPRAERDVERLPRREQVRVLRAIAALAEQPRPDGCVKLKAGKGERDVWRIRIGDYRVLYEIHDDRLIVLVLRAGHRKDIYREGR